MKASFNKKRVSAVILAFLFLTMSLLKVDAGAQAPITRRQVENRALSMINLQWNYSSAKNGVLNSGYAWAVTKPAQLQNLVSGQATGIPYSWGGFDSQYSTSYNAPWTSFQDAINKGAHAGNVNTSAGYGLIPGTVGLDCSGFVQAAFNIKDYKISTYTIFNTYFRRIPLGDIKHMDIMNKAGVHVVIFDRWGTFNGEAGAYTFEATTSQTRGGIQGTKRYFRSMKEINSGYVAGRYVNIIEGTDSTSVALPHPVEIGAFAQISNIATAASLKSIHSQNSTQVSTLSKIEAAKLTGYSKGWYQLSYNGEVKWVWGQFISAIPSGK